MRIDSVVIKIIIKNYYIIKLISIYLPIVKFVLHNKGIYYDYFFNYVNISFTL